MAPMDRVIRSAIFLPCLLRLENFELLNKRDVRHPAEYRDATLLDETGSRPKTWDMKEGTKRTKLPNTIREERRKAIRQ